MANLAEAGNTFNPALAVLKLRGYRTRVVHDEQTGESNYKAYRGECDFWASSPEALLGIVCIWETYGENWQSAIRGVDFDEEEEFTEDLKGCITATITDENGTRTITY